MQSNTIANCFMQHAVVGPYFCRLLGSTLMGLNINVDRFACMLQRREGLMQHVMGTVLTTSAECLVVISMLHEIELWIVAYAGYSGKAHATSDGY